MFKYSQNIALSLISVSLCTENAKVVTHSYFCTVQYIHWSKTTHQPYSNSPQSLWGKKPLVSWNIVLMETFVSLRLKRKCVKTQISKIIMGMWCLEGPEAYLCFDESTHLGRVVNVHQNLRMLWGNKVEPHSAGEQGCSRYLWVWGKKSGLTNTDMWYYSHWALRMTVTQPVKSRMFWGMCIFLWE